MKKKRVDMKRTFYNRLQIVWLFITTNKYDKPYKRNLWSVHWWFSMWKDSKVLGN